MSVLQKHYMIPYNIRYVHCTYEIYIEVFKNVPPVYNYVNYSTLNMSLGCCSVTIALYQQLSSVHVATIWPALGGEDNSYSLSLLLYNELLGKI